MSIVSTTKYALALATAAVFTATTPLTSAATFNFVPIEFQDAADPGDLFNDPFLSPIEVALQLIENQGKIQFLILNSSDQTDPNVDGSRPAVTSIYVEDPNNLLGGGGIGYFDSAGSLGTVAGEGVDYNDSVLGGTLQGKNNVSPSFDATFTFNPKPTGAKNGIDPGEQGSFEVGTATVAEVQAGIESGDIRVGLHIQQIGENGESSAGYILEGTVIPEPSTSLLSLLGAGLLLFRRRR